MILECSGVETDKYVIPKFKLRESEIIVINLFGGAHHFQVESELVDLFTGKAENKRIKIGEPLTFAEHIKESRFKQILSPVTVEQYIEKKANPNNRIAERIYGFSHISKQTQVNTLSGNFKRMLSIFVALSQNRNLIFDLAGVDPKGGDEIYGLIKDFVREKGAAIFLDWTPDMRNDCTRYIEIILK